MLNSFSKLLLFLLAYLVVLDALIYSYLNHYFTILIGIGSIVTFSVFVLLFNSLMLKLLKEINGTSYMIKIEENKNTDYLIFIVTFLFPLISLQVSMFYLILMIVILLMIFFIYVDTNILAVNPFLKIFFKYNIYRAKLNNTTSYILSKLDLDNTEVELKLIPIGNRIYISKEE